MERRRTVRNATAGGVQVVLSAAVLVVLYRFLYLELGIEAFGVWGLVLAACSSLHIAGLGLGASAVKFVAQYSARGDEDAVRRVVATTTVSVAVLVGAGLLLAYPLLAWLLALVVTPAAALPAALLILPYALAAFWLLSVASVFQGCLDGLQRVDLRAGLIVAGQLAFLLLALLWVPAQGLVGLARAQIAQGALLCLAGWLLLRRSAPFLPLFPLCWRRHTFREMVGYGVSFQVIAITTLLLDPITKALLARIGGVGAVGVYELVYRLVTYLKAFIVSAHQALVPALAGLYETAPERLPHIYRQSFRLLALVVTVALPLLLVVLPDAGVLWLGEADASFRLFGSLLLVAWFLNVLANPAYFAFLGSGELRWNVIGHGTIALLNVALGLGLGLLAGAAGVVTGFAVALVTGSALIAWAYQRRHGIRLAELVERATVRAAAVAVLALILVRLALDASGLAADPLLALAGTVLVYALALAPVLLSHPLRPWLGQLGLALVGRGEARGGLS
jgi:O-antigen/teichoic acid export membrane protein